MSSTELDRQKLLLGEAFENVRKKHVCVVGTGAIGSNIAINLARNGFSKITLVDLDKVETPNIGTQEFFQDQKGLQKTKALSLTLKRINENIIVRTVDSDFRNAEKTISSCDVVMDGLDSMSLRFELNLLTVKYGKDYILSACAGFSGMSAYFPAGGPCLECVFPGRKVRESSCAPGARQIGVLPETAKVAASISTVLLLTNQQSVLVGYGLNTSSMEKVRIKKRVDCPVCR